MKGKTLNVLGNKVDISWDEEVALVETDIEAGDDSQFSAGIDGMTSTLMALIYHGIIDPEHPELEAALVESVEALANYLL